MLFILDYYHQHSKNTSESEIVRPKFVSPHITKELNSSMAIIVLGITCDHCIVKNSVLHTEWDSTKYFLSYL